MLIGTSAAVVVGGKSKGREVKGIEVGVELGDAVGLGVVVAGETVTVPVIIAP
jgi:hypothetical protein